MFQSNFKKQDSDSREQIILNIGVPLNPRSNELLKLGEIDPSPLVRLSSAKKLANNFLYLSENNLNLAVDQLFQRFNESKVIEENDSRFNNPNNERATFNYHLTTLMIFQRIIDDEFGTPLTKKIANTLFDSDYQKNIISAFEEPIDLNIFKDLPDSKNIENRYSVLNRVTAYTIKQARIINLDTRKKLNIELSKEHFDSLRKQIPRIRATLNTTYSILHAISNHTIDNQNLAFDISLLNSHSSMIHLKLSS